MLRTQAKIISAFGCLCAAAAALRFLARAGPLTAKRALQQPRHLGADEIISAWVLNNRSIVALTLLLVSFAARADFNDGVVALMAGKFETALKVFVPLAESDKHAYAQYFLARMYERGQGVGQDSKVAARWYRKAAESGVNDAQFRLAAMYESGEGVPQDLEYAYGWYSVAAHLGSAKAGPAMARTKTQMRGDEWVQAHKLARELISKYGVVPETTSRSQ